MMKEPVDHIERPRLPWRSADDPALTECGYPAVKVKTIMRSELQRRFKEYGQQRTALLTCWTCLETARRWGTWEDDPRQAISREIQWERGDGTRGVFLRDELRAIAKLIENHPEEFSSLVKQFQGTIDFLTERMKPRTKKVRPE